MYKSIFLFTSIFTIIVLILLNTILNIKIEGIFIYLFAYIFVFFVAYVLQILKKEIKVYNFDLSWINILKYILVLTYTIVAYKFLDFNILSEFLVGYTIFCIIFFIDSRISFLITVCFMSFVSAYLIVWDKLKAENLSIYAYYFLVIWVLMTIYENYNLKKLKDNYNTDE